VTEQLQSPGVPDILSAEFEVDPPAFFRRMRDDFPLIHHEESGYYFISRHADVERALKDETAYSTRHQEWQLEPVIGRSLGGMTGHEHATQRSLVAPSFRGKALGERFMTVIEANATRLLDQLPASGSVDLVDGFSRWFPINVIADMLGLPKGDHERFHDWYSSFMAFLSNITQDPEVIAWGERTKREFPEYILPIIRERRERPGEDLVSILATAEIDGARMTDGQIQSFIALLLIAGGETTDKAVASLFKNLLDNPDQLAALRADRSLVTRALAETLRFSPPVNIVLRTAEVEVEIPDGGVIPARSTVACVVGAANRDERRFADPDRFDINRADLEPEKAFGGAAHHLAFGKGRHFCVGSFLAKAEVETAANQILDRMPGLAYAPGFEAIDSGLFTRAPESLQVTY
jgi:pulcherriminic acid synthase